MYGAPSQVTLPWDVVRLDAKPPLNKAELKTLLRPPFGWTKLEQRLDRLQARASIVSSEPARLFCIPTCPPSPIHPTSTHPPSPAFPSLATDE